MNPFFHALLASELVQQLFYDSDQQITGFKPMAITYTWCMALNPVDGYYYFQTLTTGGDPLNRSQFVFKYDRVKNEIIQVVHIPKSAEITSSYDSHTIGVITFDAIGNVFMAVEKGANSTGHSDGHNTDLLIYKTTTPGDLQTVSLWKTLPGKYSYPKLWINGNNFYAGARGTRASIDLTKWTLEKSIDGGETWNAYTVIDIPTATPLKRAYTRNIHHYDGDMVQVLNVRNNETGVWESVSILRSVDGINWANWEQAYNKNVNVTGALSLPEIEANMLLWKIDSNIGETIMFEGGVARGSECVALITRSVTTGTVVDNNAETQYREARLYKNAGTGWSYVDVSHILITDYTHVWGHEPTIFYANTIDHDVIYIIDKSDFSSQKVYEYSSRDNFSTWNKREIFQGSGNYTIGHLTPNVKYLDEQVLILIEHHGAIFSLDNYANLIIVNL